MGYGCVRGLVSAIYRSTPTFFRTILLHFMPNFDIMLWVFILSPREGLFFINFMPFTQGLLMVFGEAND